MTNAMEVLLRIGPGLRAPVRAALLALTACLLAACTRTVEWDEEVLLNTEETVWVHRAVSYQWTNSTPVATHWGYELDRRNTIAFEYWGRRYSHTTDGSCRSLRCRRKEPRTW